MDYCKNSLFQILQYHPQGINLVYVKKIIWQLLIFLKRLEDIGIVHTDLKVACYQQPGNIMLRDGDFLGIMVVDFNSSILMNSLHHSTAQSLYYRAPEVCIGMEYSYPIDMWSLGCILFELHYGHPLFRCENESRVLAKMQSIFGQIPQEMICLGHKSPQYYSLRNGVYTLLQDYELSKVSLNGISVWTQICQKNGEDSPAIV